MIKRKRTLKRLNDKIQSCQRCQIAKLSFNIKDISKGYGKLYGWKGGEKKCRFFFIGMNPSYRRFERLEYAFGGKDFSEGTGVEFVGFLKKMGIIDESYISNIVKCSTTDNKINDVHISHCIEYLIEEYEILKPEKILAMGKDAYNALLMNLDRDSELSYKLFSIWHPNYVMSYHREKIPQFLKKIEKICQ